MRILLEVIMSLLSVVGLLSIGWLCFGHFLTPAGNGQTVILLPGRGEGVDLEQTVAGLLWLRGSGLAEGRILIVDCGLSPAGEAAAQLLCGREPAVGLCPLEELETYIKRTADRP